jgi:hypothetical protein
MQFLVVDPPKTVERKYGSISEPAIPPALPIENLQQFNQASQQGEETNLRMMPGLKSLLPRA